MDKNLFSKYTQQIQKQNNKKQEVCLFIKEKTGVEILESEIEIDINKIHLYISSIKKNSLHKKNIQTLLKEKGYVLQ